MRHVLHILTTPDDPLAQTVSAAQSAQPENHVHVADLTQPEPDYARLLEEIFAADSIAVW